MPLLDHEIARREGGQLLLRPTPLRVRWRLEDLLSADSHRLSCAFSCSVRALDDPAERGMLSETLLTPHRPNATVDDVVSHFMPALTQAARRTAESQPASRWLEADAAQTMQQALLDSARRVAFSCGLELLPPHEVELDSPTVHQQKLDDLHRQVAQRHAAEQAEHVGRALALLRQFEQLRHDAPHLTTSDLLRQVSPADQGSLLQSLLLASAGQQPAQDLWAVAGQSLVRIVPDDMQPQVQPVELPTSLGPLRSVQTARIDDRSAMLVGAQSGVLVADRDDPAQATPYADPEATSAQGFSRAVYWNGNLWACHGEAGIVAWRIDEPAKPCLALRPAQLGEQVTPRHLQPLDQRRLIFSGGPHLFTATQSGQVQRYPLDSAAEVIGVVPAGDSLIIAHADGQLARRTVRTMEPLPGLGPRPGRVLAMSVIPWLGSVRLLLAGEDGPVDCIGLDDPLLTQYGSPHRGLRMLAASASHVAAVSADRQRLVIWHTWDGRHPAAELHLTALTRHRIADIAFDQPDLRP